MKKILILTQFFIKSEFSYKNQLIPLMLIIFQLILIYLNNKLFIPIIYLLAFLMNCYQLAINDKEDGTYEQIILAGVSNKQYLTAKLTARVVLTLLSPFVALILFLHT